MIETFLVIGLIIVFTMLLCLYRAAFGPGVYNRIAATSIIGTKAVVLLVAIGYMFERPMFVDIALLYAMLNFIGTLLMAKYLVRGEICTA